MAGEQKLLTGFHLADVHIFSLEKTFNTVLFVIAQSKTNISKVLKVKTRGPNELRP